MAKVAFITGATGQDFSYLAEHLLAEGTKVYGLVRRSARSDLGALDHPSCSIKEEVTLLNGDVTDETSLLRAMSEACLLSGESRIDELYHLAAMSHVGVSHKSPASTFHINTIGTINTLNTLFTLGDEYSFKPRAYFAATSECFLGDPETCPQDESTLMEPQSPYAISKVAGVHYCRYLRQLGRFVSTGMLFNHESPRRHTDFVTRKITYNLAKIKLGLLDKFGLGNLDSKRDWSHASDMTMGMIKILRYSEPNEFVLGSSVTRSVRDFVEAGIRGLDLPGELEDYVYVDPAFVRPTEVWELRGNATKAKVVLGWRPLITFDEMVKEMCEWDLMMLERT